jgi:hypothetical protein
MSVDRLYAKPHVTLFARVQRRNMNLNVHLFLMQTLLD